MPARPVRDPHRDTGLPAAGFRQQRPTAALLGPISHEVGRAIANVSRVRSAEGEGCGDLDVAEDTSYEILVSKRDEYRRLGGNPVFDRMPGDQP